MGVAITEIIPSREIALSDLTGRVIAIDTPLFLYQFLSTIRTPDGALLMDARGRVTSHLLGLFNRTVKFLELGIKPVFVFDGTPPSLKASEVQRRRRLKQEAQMKELIARDTGDIDAAQRYAKRTSMLTRDMIDSAKQLITLLGLPLVQAPAEGEAQAAFMVKRGDAWAVASNDVDALLFGAPRVVKNLAISGRRKRTGKLQSVTIHPELIELAHVMNTLGIDQERFIALCVLVGTDFNPDGVSGIGPKKALKLVQEFGLEAFAHVTWTHEASPADIMELITTMPVTETYDLAFRAIDNKRIEALLDEYGFDQERVRKQLAELKRETVEQRGLGEFFK